MIVVDKTQMTDFVWRREQIPHIWELKKNADTDRFQPVLTPIEAKIHGVPPTRIGPFLNGQIQPILLFVADDKFIDDNIEWLRQLEEHVHKVLSHKLIVTSMTDQTPEDVSKWINDTINISNNVSCTIFMMGDEVYEAHDHDVWGRITKSKFYIGDNIGKSFEFYDLTLEREELTQEFIEKIVNAIT
jgi:hypothetical protein